MYEQKPDAPPPAELATKEGCKVKNAPRDLYSLDRYATELSWKGRCVNGFAQGAGIISRAFHYQGTDEIRQLVYKGAYVNGDMSGAWLRTAVWPDGGTIDSADVVLYGKGKSYGGAYWRNKEFAKASIVLDFHIPVLDDIGRLAASEKIASIPVAEIERDLRKWATLPDWKPSQLVAAPDAPLVAGRLTADQLNRPITRERLKEVFGVEKLNPTYDEISALLALPKGKRPDQPSFKRCIASAPPFADAEAEKAYQAAPAAQRMFGLWGRAHFGAAAALGDCADMKFIASQWLAALGRPDKAPITAGDIAKLRTSWVAARTPCASPIKGSANPAQATPVDLATLNGGMTAERVELLVAGSSCRRLNPASLACEGNLRFANLRVDSMQVTFGDEGTLVSLSMSALTDTGQIGGVFDRAFGARKTELEDFSSTRLVQREVGRTTDLEVGPGGRLTEVDVRLIGNVEQTTYQTRATHSWKTDMFSGINNESHYSIKYERCR